MEIFPKKNMKISAPFDCHPDRGSIGIRIRATQAARSTHKPKNFLSSRTRRLRFPQRTKPNYPSFHSSLFTINCQLSIINYSLLIIPPPLTHSYCSPDVSDSHCSVCTSLCRRQTAEPYYILSRSYPSSQTASQYSPDQMMKC